MENKGVILQLLQYEDSSCTINEVIEQLLQLWIDF